MNGEKSEKTRLRWLRAILSWVSRQISWLYHTLMDRWLRRLRTILAWVSRQISWLHRTIMDRRFWRVWFRRIKRVGLVTVKWIAFVIAFCIWPIGLLVLLYELIACLSPSLAAVLSPSLADLFPSLKDLFNHKTDPNTDLFSRVRVNMIILTAWVGVFFLVWRTRIADKQTQINQESHYTDLFTKAVEQLGAVREVPDKEPKPALEIRIGAIYSLERLAKDSERDYGPIIETLATYIREHCRGPQSFDDEGLTGEELNQAWQEWIQSLKENSPADRSDVAAALMVLSRREKNRNWPSTSDDETQPDFTGANFQGATLWNKSEGLAREGTNLRLADLSGADLWGANLSGADLWGANLSGAGLSEANLSGATNLSGADLSGADLSGANLSGADLWGANLSGATNLSEANLSGANLWRANLSGANLWRANLSGANLSEANLSDATNFSGANLSGANLWRANLSGANLSEANLFGTDLSEASLSHALLAGVHLQDSNGLTTEMLKEAFGDENTFLPNGVTPPSHWGSQQEAIERWEAFCKGVKVL